jgi:hypothetical protein
MSDTWMLERQGDDRYDLLRNGRRLLSGVTVTEIRRYLKTRRGTRDKVYWEEHDGYLTSFK